MNLHGNPLPRPLEGIRIVECGVWHAGPGASAILADLGAEVIKIESLDGDPERHKACADWLALFQSRGLLFVPVQTMADVLRDPQARLNGYVVEVDHPTMGRVSLPGCPVQFSANSTGIDPAPDRCQHFGGVLASIGYAADDIEGLRVVK